MKLLLIIPALTIVSACTAPGQTCQPDQPISYTKSGSPVYADPEPTLGGCRKPAVAVIYARDGSGGAHGRPVASDDKPGDHHSRPDPSPSDPKDQPPSEPPADKPSKQKDDNSDANGKGGNKHNRADKDKAAQEIAERKKGGDT